MNNDIQQKRDDIIEALLPAVIFDGWTREALENAAITAGYNKSMAHAVFPDGTADAVRHFSDWADRRMLDTLADIDPQDMRIRDRIATGVITRFGILAPYREAVRKALAYWAVPVRSIKAGGALWQTADHIWTWAGDESTDYNHYTKRGLLSSVIASTTLVWLNDKSSQSAETKEFLDRRIENIVRFGKFLGKMKRAA